MKLLLDEEETNNIPTFLSLTANATKTKNKNTKKQKRLPYCDTKNLHLNIVW